MFVFLPYFINQRSSFTSKSHSGLLFFTSPFPNLNPPPTSWNPTLQNPKLPPTLHFGFLSAATPPNPRRAVRTRTPRLYLGAREWVEWGRRGWSGNRQFCGRRSAHNVSGREKRCAGAGAEGCACAPPRPAAGMPGGRAEGGVGLPVGRGGRRGKGPRARARSRRRSPSLPPSLPSSPHTQAHTHTPSPASSPRAARPAGPARPRALGRESRDVGAAAT